MIMQIGSNAMRKTRRHTKDPLDMRLLNMEDIKYKY